MKTDIEYGHASIEDLAYWINERHSIYLRKEAGKKKPWTDDPIFQQWAFTNAFRQLDKGTVALGKMLLHSDLHLLAWNIIWYRLFNWHEHAIFPGWCNSPKRLHYAIVKKYMEHKRIFTNAHMTTGVPGEAKHISYLRASTEAWNFRQRIVEVCSTDSMEQVFNYLRNLYMIGKFVAYEIVCDFRFTSLLNKADTMTWANVGPGAARGLRRLGMPETLESMIEIYNLLYEHGCLDTEILNARVPFELREVEHSLCEFDKYQRVKTGAGRPRRKYNGCSS